MPISCRDLRQALPPRTLAAEKRQEGRDGPDAVSRDGDAGCAAGGISLALQTLWWDAKGDWNRAHQCAQQDEGKTGSAVHAYLHRKEGDMRNAGGWYNRAGREPATVSLEEEWQSLAEEMLSVRRAGDGARAAMDGFMAAFNARDADAIRITLVSLSACALPQRNRHRDAGPADYDNRVWNSDGESADWGRSAWDHVEVIDAGPEKVHFRVRFTRYRADGSAGSAGYRSLYIVDFQARALGDPGTLELGRMTGRARWTRMPRRRRCG